jgi:hypothetical protein
VIGQYSKLETPEAQLEYLLLFVCRPRSASSQVSVISPNLSLSAVGTRIRGPGNETSTCGDLELL